MRTLTLGLLGAVALTAGLLLARARQQPLRSAQAPTAVENDAEGAGFLNRLRESGI